VGGRGSGRPCRSCSHPERRRIDEDLCLAPNVREVARRYGLTKSCVEWHYNNHVALTKEERSAYRLAAVARHIAETRALAPEIEAREREKEEQIRALRLEAEQLRKEKRGVLDQWQQLKAANAIVWQVVEDLRKAKDGETGAGKLSRSRALLEAADRIEKQLRLQAALVGDLTEGATVNVQLHQLLLSPDYLLMKRAAQSIAERWPEASAEYVAALRSLEEKAKLERPALPSAAETVA